MTLCELAQHQFDAFIEMNVVPFGQLFGGKICAALDRQHPRDLFDIKYLLQNEGIRDDVRQGFILCLLSCNRPIHELIEPNRLNQRETMAVHFEGMTSEEFSYDEYEHTREQLIKAIHLSLTDHDKEFILSVEAGLPRWDFYEFAHFPAVRWKLQNIKSLIRNQPNKHQAHLNKLKEKLYSA